MKKSLRKLSLMIAMMMAACFLLVGCSKEKTILIKLDGIGEYTLVDYPEGVTGGVTDDGVTVTLEKEGEYALDFQNDDGKEYTVTLTYDKNGVSGVCDSEDITGLQLSAY